VNRLAYCRLLIILKLSSNDYYFKKEFKNILTRSIPNFN